MNDGKLDTAILGLNEGGQLLLKASEAVDYLRILAVADKDTILAEKIAGQYTACRFIKSWMSNVGVTKNEKTTSLHQKQ